MTQYENIIFNIEDKIAWLKFNRPQQLNAMNSDMMNEIIDALKKIDAASADDIRVAVITGIGKAFMAGADIKEYASQTEAQFNDFQKNGRNVYTLIEENSKPVIAAINGFAFGGGLEIALACDMIVAAEGAKMGLPEILLNLIPGGGGTIRLAKKIGVNRTNEIVMAGKTILADELCTYGAINHLFPVSSFEDDVKKFAIGFTDKAPENLKVLKLLSQMAADGRSAEAEVVEHDSLTRFYKSEAAQQKIKEFYNKSLERKK